MYNNPLKDMRQEFLSLLEGAISKGYANAGLDPGDIENSIVPGRQGHGDLSSSVSFRIAKTLKLNPNDVANTLAGSMRSTKRFSKISVESAYINASFDRKLYAKKVITGVLRLGDKYGVGDAGKGRKVIVEFPSVNPNKPWHIGHLRNALLGDAISNIMESNSFRVEREDYIDDLGLQIAVSLWGYKNVDSNPDTKFDTWLGQQYVIVNKRMENSDVKREVEELLKRIEISGTPESMENRKLAEKCVRAQYQTAYNYNIWHDTLVWESDIIRERMLDRAVGILKERDMVHVPIAGKYRDCLVLKLEGAGRDEDEENAKVIIRSNGVPTYIAKDFAFHLWKIGMIPDQFNYSVFGEEQAEGRVLYSTSEKGKMIKGHGDADIAVNIIGAAQSQQQSILKYMIKGASNSKKEVIHLSYGEVDVEGGSLSGRTGGWIGEQKSYTADSLLSESVSRVKGIMKEKGHGGEERIAKEVALSAIKFEFLKVSPEKKIVFSWDKALDFSGNSGPYCMYTYARASKIVEKERRMKLEEKDLDYISDGIDYDLIKAIGSVPEAVEKAANEYRPTVIADTLLDISMLFSKFYETMPVLKAEKERRVRLAITYSVKQSVGNMLKILGITPLETI